MSMEKETAAQWVERIHREDQASMAPWERDVPGGQPGGTWGELFIGLIVIGLVIFATIRI